MAGFLRQLAEQALQPATHLRSAAATPYAAAVGRHDGSDRLSDAPVLSARNAAPPPPESGVVHARAQATDGVESPAQEEVRRHATAPRGLDIQEDLPPPGPASIPHTDVPINAIARSGVRPSGSTVPATREAPHLLSPSAGSPARDAIAASPSQPPRENSAPRRKRVPADAPAPVRPVATRVSAARQNPATPSGIGQDAGRPAPEVHIHIGRIELTAPTPAPAARRESGAGRKPLSLDAYLQQRRGKSP